MKYLLLLGDGMSDLPVPELLGKTPLQCAHKPIMDALAAKGEVGMVNITPPGCIGGSDVGNLAALGYDPRIYLTGRSPLEAAAIGIVMAEDDLALRCNLVCLSDEKDYTQKTMLDNSSGEISTAEAQQLIEALNAQLKSTSLEFFTGVSYRHCLILHQAQDAMLLTPPHDILEQKVTEFLPQGDHSELLTELMKKSVEILSSHPVNLERIRQGKVPANSIWLWGQGRKPGLSSFSQKYGKQGAVVTAVDLLRGIGHLAEMRIMEVEGATGNLDTNFIGKAQAALTAFSEGCDFCYLHVEAPDECGHRHQVEGKVQSIEMLDHILKIVLEDLHMQGEACSVLIMPDHPTPLVTRTHSSDPVPYLLYRSDREQTLGISCFCEDQAQKTGVVQIEGYSLLERFLNG